MPFDLPTLRARIGGHAPALVSTDHGGPTAAVAVVVREGPMGPEALFIERAHRVGDPWSGDFAFPGGRSAQEDFDLADTAARETREEVGVDLAACATLLGRLDDVRAVGRRGPTGLVISPYAFELVAEATLVPNHEVARALWLPLLPLARGERETRMRYEKDGHSWEFPAYQVEDGGGVVWGLTYRMLDGLFAIVR